MAKSIAMSCAVCLSVEDRGDMLPVTMAHSTPPQSRPLYLCRRCVIEIMKSALQSEIIDPREVFGDDPVGAANAPGPGGDPPPAEAAPALVSEAQPGAQDSVVDRLESEVPAGGSGGGAETSEGELSQQVGRRGHRAKWALSTKFC